MNKRQTGLQYEEKAAEYMKQQGYQILDANWRCLYGEIDLIARDGDQLVFCEVKTRTEDGIGTPGEAVSLSKQKKLTAAALSYLSEHPSGLQPRFDVVEVTLSGGNGAVLSVEHLKNAFSAQQ